MSTALSLADFRRARSEQVHVDGARVGASNHLPTACLRGSPADPHPPWTHPALELGGCISLSLAGSPMAPSEPSTVMEAEAMYLARCAAPACKTPRLSRARSVQHLERGDSSPSLSSARSLPPGLRAVVRGPRRRHRYAQHVRLIYAVLIAAPAGWPAPHTSRHKILWLFAI